MAEQRTLEAERADFEAFAISQGWDTGRNKAGEYYSSSMDRSWSVWQAARRAPPALDAEGLPELPKPVRMSADQAYLGYTAEQVRQAMRDAVAADRRMRDVSVINYGNPVDKFARQSAPEGAPVCQAGTGDGQWLDIRPEDAETWRKIYYTVRTLYAPTSASAQPADVQKQHV